MTDEVPRPGDSAENPEDVAGQDRLTVEADTVVSAPALVRRGWGASIFESFRHRDFTLFWSGALVSNVGSWMRIPAKSSSVTVQAGHRNGRSRTGLGSGDAVCLH
jgi:hypothetical protein